MFLFFYYSVSLFLSLFFVVVIYTSSVLLLLGRIRIMVFNATFNIISAVSWRSVLLVEETGENPLPAASHGQTLSHTVVSSTQRLSEIRAHNVSGDRYWLHW